MEKELDPEVIKATQNTLGKFVKRPQLTEKLLKKPPFRFLHDIVTTVLKTTGFFEGLFEEAELVSDNVKDRESKIAFLNKVITILGTTTGKSLSVKPSKVVAGQEPEKTNELLQCLALALDNKLSSDEAVKLFKNGVKPSADTNTKEATKNVKRITEKPNESIKKLTSRSSEKITSNKRDTKDRSLTRNDKDKITATKAKQNPVVKKDSPPNNQKQPTVVKKDSPPNNQKQPKAPVKKNKEPKHESENATLKTNEATPDNTESLSNQKEIDRNYQDSEVHPDNPTVTNIIAESILETIQSNTQNEETQPKSENLHTAASDQGKINDSTKSEIDLNSSLSSQDLMEVNNDGINENESAENKKSLGNDYEPSKLHVFNTSNKAESQGSARRSTRSGVNGGHQSPKNNDHSSIREPNKNERLQSRLKSVRPSSSRPGAPRLREKHESVLPANDNLLVGKVNIIVENTPNEEEEDSNSIIIVDQPTESTTQQSEEQLQLSSTQHGHLVQQILESQKEFSGGKTEIEWQFGAQKTREAVNQEVEQLRFNIQALSRVANPLGKLLDHIQEDVEVMRQELQQWTKTFEETSKELQKQKTANEDSLFPLHTKLKQLDTDIEEKRDKINDLKIVVHKNSSRIEKLLAGGDVQ